MLALFLGLARALPLPSTGAEAALERVPGENRLMLRWAPIASARFVTIYQSRAEMADDGTFSWLPWKVIPQAGAAEASQSIPVELVFPGQFFRVEVSHLEVDPNLVWISPGRFAMGSSNSEAGRYPDEGPQREVEIADGFWMSRYEVTQGEFQSRMGANPSKSGYLENDRAPVESVTWYDAVKYCEKRTEAARAAGQLPPGYVYRLPTEAEWEYACRAGTTTSYSYGEDIEALDRHAWWAGNGGAAPHTVGLLKPNPWGLYDMHGNVFEWCLDRYAPYPGGDAHAGRDLRVVRSGAFYCPANVVRSACRFESRTASSPSWLVGFRIVLGPERAAATGP